MPNKRPYYSTFRHWLDTAYDADFDGVPDILLSIKNDVGLENVDNTADLDKPISNATQAALNTKQNTLISGTNIKTVNGNSLVGSGAVTLTKTDVGLSNVDNTSDINKPISSATTAALNTKQDALVSGNNIKTVNGNSLVGSGAVTLTKTDVGLSNVDNTTDVSKPISTATQNALNNKQDALVSGTNIRSINGTSILGTGNIVLTKNDVSLNNVDNTSDTSKPVSTATQLALNAKQDVLVNETNIKSVNGNTLVGSGTVTLTKTDVGLGNVDNTSDINKPISTATQTALNATVPATKGGTGNTSYTVGDLLYADTATTLAKLPDVAVGKVLTSGGVGVAPAWGQVTLGSSMVSGYCTIVKGGTNSQTALTNNKVMVANAGSIVEGPAQNNGQLLIGSTGSMPVAANITGSNGVAVTNGAGTIDVSLTTPVTAARGGTGQTAYVVGDILTADTTTTLLKIAPQAVGTVLRSNGIGVVPSFASLAISETTGVLSTTKGGTGTSQSMTGKKVIVSNAGGMIEGPALTDGQLLIGSTGNTPVAANITGGSGIQVINTSGNIQIKTNIGVYATYNTNQLTVASPIPETMAASELAIPSGTYYVTAYGQFHNDIGSGTNFAVGYYDGVGIANKTPEQLVGGDVWSDGTGWKNLKTHGVISVTGGILMMRWHCWAGVSKVTYRRLDAIKIG